MNFFLVVVSRMKGHYSNLLLTWQQTLSGDLTLSYFQAVPVFKKQRRIATVEIPYVDMNQFNQLWITLGSNFLQCGLHLRDWFWDDSCVSCRECVPQSRPMLCLCCRAPQPGVRHLTLPCPPNQNEWMSAPLTTKAQSNSKLLGLFPQGAWIWLAAVVCTSWHCHPSPLKW